MKPLEINDVLQYVENNISSFHQKRIAGLTDLKLNKVLVKKNPYLYKAKYILTAPEIIIRLADAFISSQEETIFGDWLEGLAIFINEKVYNGWKSGIPGIDLEFDKDGVRYIVTIKSGPNWGNSRAIAGMLNDFKTAKRTLRTSNSGLIIVAVNGCCYGRSPSDCGEYFKYCGQAFWEFISGDPDLYLKIIEPLGSKAKERNDEFQLAYAKMINKFTKEFADSFCTDSGDIDWAKLLEFNSGKGTKRRKPTASS